MQSDDDYDFYGSNPPPSGDDPVYETDDPLEEHARYAEEMASRDPVQYRASRSDHIFGYLLALALSFGLLPLIPFNADLRYTLSWGLIALFGVLAWLFGTTGRIERERVDHLAWGLVFALIVGAPLLLVGGDTLATTARLIFQTGIGAEIRALPPGAVLAYLVFVMPLAETLFFRGYMQQTHSFGLVGMLSSVWAIVLFIPMLDVGAYPLIAVIISIALITINLMYSYVRQRDGLAAAWVCQIAINVVLLFLPYVSS